MRDEDSPERDADISRRKSFNRRREKGAVVLKWMFLIADAVLVLLFIAGMAARYVHPRYAWLLQVVALGLPILAIAVVVVSSAALFTGRWYLLAAHVPLLIVALIRFFPVSWFSSSGDPREERLTVVSANVKEKSPESGSVLASLPTDRPPNVIAVQETHIVRGGGGIGAEGHVFPLLLGYRACASENGESSRRDRIEHPIFSDLPCEMMEIESVAERGGRRPIMATRGEFTWRGRRFALYNVHLRSFSVPQAARSDLFGWFMKGGRFATLRRDFVVRAREAEALRRMLEAESLPFILCGDFNSTPHQWSYAHLAAGFTDAFAKAGRGWRPTFHSRLPLISIDHFLVSDEWRVASARTGNVSVSDHLPLIVDLAWRSRADA